MRCSDISRLLDGELSATEFRESNTSSLTECRDLSEKRGAAIPIRVAEDVDFQVTSEHIAAACELRAKGELRACGGTGISGRSALQLSSTVSFLNEDLAEYVAEFTDPEINGPFTSERAREIISEIQSNI